MADYRTTSSELKSIANAIRGKFGASQSTMVFPNGFVSAIQALRTVGVAVTSSDISTDFKNNTVITTVYSTNITTIGLRGFDGCTSLTSVELTNVTSLPNYCFNSCSNLLTIKLSKCTSIGAHAFNGCSKLTDLYLSSTTICSVASKATVTELPMTTTIHVPSSLLSSYKSATYWSERASQFVSI